MIAQSVGRLLHCGAPSREKHASARYSAVVKDVWIHHLLVFGLPKRW